MAQLEGGWVVRLFSCHISVHTCLEFSVYHKISSKQDYYVLLGRFHIPVGTNQTPEPIYLRKIELWVPLSFQMSNLSLTIWIGMDCAMFSFALLNRLLYGIVVPGDDNSNRLKMSYLCLGHTNHHATAMLSATHFLRVEVIWVHNQPC